MKFFVIRYDYGTGSTYLGVLAERTEDILGGLRDVAVVDPLVEGLDKSHIQRLKNAARALDDPTWADMRR